MCSYMCKIPNMKTGLPVPSSLSYAATFVKYKPFCFNCSTTDVNICFASSVLPCFILNETLALLILWVHPSWITIAAANISEQLLMIFEQNALCNAQ